MQYFTQWLFNKYGNLLVLWNFMQFTQSLKSSVFLPYNPSFLMQGIICPTWMSLRETCLLNEDLFFFSSYIFSSWYRYFSFSFSSVIQRVSSCSVFLSSCNHSGLSCEMEVLSLSIAVASGTSHMLWGVICLSWELSCSMRRVFKSFDFFLSENILWFAPTFLTTFCCIWYTFLYSSLYSAVVAVWLNLYFLFYFFSLK